LSLRDWFERVLRGHEFSGGPTQPVDGVDSIKEATIKGMPALEVVGTVLGVVERRTYFLAPNKVVEFSDSYPDFMVEPNVVGEMLSTLTVL
jgi:hypothetical protein